MTGWLFLIIVSTLVMTPVYRFIMLRIAVSARPASFLAVAVISIAASFALYRSDPRGIAGPGYLLIFVVGPFTIGWLVCGLVNLMAWGLRKRIAS